MTSFLAGSLASKLNEKLSPHLLSGSLRRENLGGVDEFGDPVSSGAQTYSFKGYRDEFSAQWRSTGVSETDYIIGILALSFTDSSGASAAITPKQDDTILLNGQWSRVRKIHRIDPATALYELMCHEIRDPTA